MGVAGSYSAIVRQFCLPFLSAPRTKSLSTCEKLTHICSPAGKATFSNIGKMDGNGCNATNYTEIGTVYVTMVSSLCSIVGSLLIIITFVIWPDLRTTGRAILVFLAIADFFSAIGYLFASILFLVSYICKTSVPPELCTFQSFVTTTFPISSFLWTANLAIYLFVSITLKKIKLARKLMLLFHVTAWGIPLLLCIPGAATGKLGNNYISDRRPEQGAVDWCWVSFNNTFNEHTNTSVVVHNLLVLHAYELVFGKFWEIVVFFLSIVLCIVVKISLQKKKKQLASIEVRSENSKYGSLNSERMKAALNQLDQRLIWIPIVFILVRWWGTLRWIIASTPECLEIDRNCSIEYGEVFFQESCYNKVYNPGLLYMQAIGDTGQGWANALLYVIFHGTISRRICPCFYLCWDRLCVKCKAYRYKRVYTPTVNSEKEVAVSTSGTSVAVKYPNLGESVEFYK